MEIRFCVGFVVVVIVVDFNKVVYDVVIVVCICVGIVIRVVVLVVIIWGVFVVFFIEIGLVCEEDVCVVILIILFVFFLMFVFFIFLFLNLVVWYLCVIYWLKKKWIDKLLKEYYFLVVS